MSEDSFAFRLKVLLEHKKISLQQVADVVGISRPAVHKWTRGGEIDYSNLRKLATFLEVNWVWLRYGDQAVKDLGLSGHTELPMTDLRRRYTAEIMSSEARMKQAQEVAGIVTWEWNLVSDELIYSGDCEKLYGRYIHSNEEFWEILHPDDAMWLNNEWMQEAIASGRPYVRAFRILLPDGQIRWIESHTATLHDDAGRPTRMIGITMDISVHKELEEELLRRISFLEDVETIAGLGAWQWDLDHDKIIASSQWCRLFGLATEAAPQQYEELCEHIHPDDRKSRQDVINHALRIQKGYQVAYRAILPDGTCCHIIEQGHVTQSEKGTFITALCRKAV